MDNSRHLLRPNRSLTILPLLNLRTMNENAELQNGRWAMIGFLAAIGAYAATGQIIPGVF
tara:strand:- start:855 stop:1034 length:180 start_codon:yes stop_codon:yes gene_type:complete